MHECKNGQHFLIGAVIGGAVGALVALLITPKSGEDLRQDLADKYGDLTDNIKETCFPGSCCRRKFFGRKWF